MKRLRYLVCAVLLTISFVAASGQAAIKKYVADSSIRMKSINPNDPEEAGLEVIGQAIGDARVVMLGEQDHGDAPTFLAKSRIIRYLHEKKGFNVLAFESDFFGLNEGWDRLPKYKDTIIRFLRSNIFPIWAYCDACSFLFEEYIPSSFLTATPLQVSGFDNQMILGYSSQYLLPRLDSTLTALAIPVWTHPVTGKRLRQALDSSRFLYSNSNKIGIDQLQLRSDLQQLKREVSGMLKETDWVLLLIDNLIRDYEKHVLYAQDDRTQGSNERDLQMALNLEWLMKVKYPGEKIIVWAANAHIAPWKGDPPKGKPEMRSMGTVFVNDLQHKEKTYIMGFTSYEGQAGRLGWPVTTVQKPRKNSFETWIPESYAYSFTNFRSFRKANPQEQSFFFMKGLGHMGFSQNWASVYDGIFFIRYMEACKR